jgi:hypothetical protein
MLQLLWQLTVRLEVQPLTHNREQIWRTPSVHVSRTDVCGTGQARPAPLQKPQVYVPHPAGQLLMTACPPRQIAVA